MRTSFIAILSALAVTACTTDYYEKGEGEYSTLQGDFVEAHANAELKIDYIKTDNDELIGMTNPVSKSWITKADSMYRSVVYYKKEGATASIESIVQIPVAVILPTKEVAKRMKRLNDPLTLESAWISKNKRFLNISLYVKSGATEDSNATQRLGIANDSTKSVNGKVTWHLRVCHDQGEVPEYYSEQTYFSLPLYKISADSLVLTFNTYDGVVTKQFSLR